ncbi:hypothetical protein B0H17DRAFT_368286 [Mycena rosella]|uniref:Uncharacterized protein n=1 Tax=Mycena rosella TaxID=1033263 RepID=A0AAD7GZM8_MYCRO|nr:hypothetical protein B0H17DRAFT_368286 [Mycena rosella]
MHSKCIRPRGRPSRAMFHPSLTPLAAETTPVHPLTTYIFPPCPRPNSSFEALKLHAFQMIPCSRTPKPTDVLSQSNSAVVSVAAETTPVHPSTAYIFPPCPRPNSSFKLHAFQMHSSSRTSKSSDVPSQSNSAAVSVATETTPVHPSTTGYIFRREFPPGCDRAGNLRRHPVDLFLDDPEDFLTSQELDADRLLRRCRSLSSPSRAYIKTAQDSVGAPKSRGV